ncbi:MAG: ComEC/Rec2 family competence protein [bacterium]
MRFSNSKIFLISIIFFILGILIASFLPNEIARNNLAWFVCLICFFVITILLWGNKNNYLKYFILFFLFLFLGIWRYSLALPTDAPNKIWHYNNQKIKFSGIVTSEPEIKKNSQQLEIKVAKIFLLSGEFTVSGKVLITTKFYPRYFYGDELEVEGEIRAPEEFSGFAYDRYLAKFNIYSVSYFPKIKIIDRKQGAWIYEKIFKLKNKLREVINFSVNEPEAGIARAVILGDKGGVDDDLKNIFSKAGISHIIAISGMHVSIIAAEILGIFLFIGFSRKHCFYLSSISLSLYILIIGLPSSAMRAGLMGFFILWALKLGRLNKITNSLVLACAIMLLINPKSLRDDVGFQLSFLAVTAIIFIYPKIKKIFQKRVEKWPKILIACLDIFIITTAVQVLTLPIMIYNFGSVSLVAPLANLLILWTLPLLMFFLPLAIIFSLLIPQIGPVFFLPSYIIIKYIIVIAEWLSKL